MIKHQYTESHTDIFDEKTSRIVVLTFFIVFHLHFGRAQQVAHHCADNSFHQIISLTSDNFNDLTFLKKKVRGKRIVLLGESAHTIGDYYKLKTRLVKYLHQECDFEVFAMEGGIADVYTIYAQIDTLSSNQLMKKTLFANLSCNEIKPLFDYLKVNSNSRKSISYCGFDSQNHGSSLALIKSLLRDYHGATTDSLVDNLKKYYQIPQLAWQADKTPVSKLSDTISSSASHLLALLSSAKTQLREKHGITEIHFKVLERSLHNHKEAVNLQWDRDNPLEKRDSLMAENIIWLSKEIFPEKKMIVWAHNTHIDKGGTDAINKSMGYYLNKKMKKQTYHIGLYAKTGELYWWWTKDTRSFNNNQPHDIENFADKYPVTFFDMAGKSHECPTKADTFTGYEAEFGKKISFVPSKRYDAIINLRSTNASTY